MKQYTVKVTKTAYAHMSEIAGYITHELFAPEAANRLLDRFQNTIENLSEMPQRYPLIDEEPWRNEGVRKIVAKNFLIYF